MNPEVVAGIDGIREDRTHGAAWLSRQAIGVMKLAAEKSAAAGIAQFLEELSAVAATLIEARPSMAPIANLVSRFLYEVTEKSRGIKELESLRGFACSTGDQLTSASAAAAAKAAEAGAGVIENGDIVMTCSYSATVCRALRIAREEARAIEVIVLESGSHGEATAQELRSHGIPVEVVPDNAITHHISRARKVLVGADSILADGSLINGTPTYELAAAARRASVPFYSVCESVKLDARSRRPKLEKGFDLVPAQLIAGLITEKGILKPAEVIDHVAEMSRHILLPKQD